MPRDAEVSRIEIQVRVVEEKQVRKHICMEAHPFSEAGGVDKRVMGEPGPGLRTQKAVLLGHLHYGLDSGPPHPPHSEHR